MNFWREIVSAEVLLAGLTLLGVIANSWRRVDSPPDGEGTIALMGGCLLTAVAAFIVF